MSLAASSYARAASSAVSNVPNHILERVANFGDPRSPMSLTNSSVPLLRSSHGGLIDCKRF
ncbi:hypothetical protein Hanom_Chr09g00829691 [Helianthus anomalus]